MEKMNSGNKLREGKSEYGKITRKFLVTGIEVLQVCGER